MEKNKYEILICVDFGGYDLSDELDDLLHANGIKEKYPSLDWDSDWCTNREIPRHDPILIKCVKELGLSKSEGRFCHLGIVEIDTPKYYIEEYDGCETVITEKDFINIEEN